MKRSGETSHSEGTTKSKRGWCREVEEEDRDVDPEEEEEDVQA